MTTSQGDGYGIQSIGCGSDADIPDLEAHKLL